MDNLKQLEERVTLLERQVAELQKQIFIEEEIMPQLEVMEEIPQPEPVAEEIPESPQPEVITENQQPEEAVILQQPEEDEAEQKWVIAGNPYLAQEAPTIHEKIETPKEDIKAKDESFSFEANIGKKIIPIAGSALILFALILFGSLIRPHLTDGMKAILLAVLSLGITGAGLWKMKKENKYYPYFSALAGCGIAACYVSTLVSHFALHVISEFVVMGIIVVWIVSVILLSKYKSKMFTYICYAGILIAAYMTVQKWCDSSLGLIVYIVSIAALFWANFSREYKQVAWLFVQYPVIMIAMSTNYSGELFPSILIYGTTLAILVGQIIFYRDRDEQSGLISITTGISLLALLMSADLSVSCSENFCSNKPILCNEIGWGIALAMTFIALSILYYRYFGNIDDKLSQNNSRRPFMLTAVASLAIVPQLYYGEFYQQWLGTYLIPGVLLIVAGMYFHHAILRYIGYAFTLFFTYSVAVPNQVWHHIMYSHTTSDGEIITNYLDLNCGVFIFLAILIGVGCWLWKNYNSIDKTILMWGILWGCIKLCISCWIDVEVCYLLLCAVIVAFNTRLLRTSPVTHESDEMIPAFALAIALCSFSVLFRITGDIIGGLWLVKIPNEYGLPLIGFIGSMMLWGMCIWRGKVKFIPLSQCIFMTNLLLSFSGSRIYLTQNLFAMGIYFLGLVAMVYWTFKHYDKVEKYCETGIVLLFCLIPCYASHIFNIFESWALCSIVMIICNLSRYEYNPVSMELEKDTRCFCMIGNFVALCIGTWMLSSYHEPLHFLEDFAGTGTAVTIGLVLITLTLAFVNVKRIYSLTSMSEISATKIDVFNGLKFTWTMAVILWRFSAASYLISIAGILLAVILVVIGFKHLLKGLRLYGLVLSMLCVVKLIFFDITFDNALYRPISFLVAGLLLFLLSFVYFKLEKQTKNLE